jgi:uncharacterized UPF0160 family protein
VEPLDIVVDVGGVYSPENHRYDHHQRGFNEVLGSGGFDKIKLSSAGLVYKCVSQAILFGGNGQGRRQSEVETAAERPS